MRKFLKKIWKRTWIICLITWLRNGLKIAPTTASLLIVNPMHTATNGNLQKRIFLIIHFYQRKWYKLKIFYPWTKFVVPSEYIKELKEFKWFKSNVINIRLEIILEESKARYSKSNKVYEKGGNPSDLVTETDRMVEELIKSRINSKFPDHK